MVFRQDFGKQQESLTTLDLSKQNLTGEFPLDLFGLLNLQVIALQENKIFCDVLEDSAVYKKDKETSRGLFNMSTTSFETINTYSCT
ncbi:hypothetical protein L2E82_20721 [Cichorium intybus]|uniref:Uncharacterized protein n=1 Tax=Cichorium intybus TaxID=13427 RepID=A0ACB9DUG4_CICIN|nr:hypothetical protein L2E82_20721 [Cichorium intybus]